MKIFQKVGLIAGALALTIPAAIVTFEPAAAAKPLSGSFKGASGYKGRGTARLVQNKDGSYQLSFSNFSVSRGPNLRVWLVKGSGSTSAAVMRSKHVELSKLKKTLGNQSYSVRKSLVDQGYQTVVIWCKPFGVLFARARLSG